MPQLPPASAGGEKKARLAPDLAGAEPAFPAALFWVARRACICRLRQSVTTNWASPSRCRTFTETSEP